jgi:hypothetical protein
LGHHTLLLLIPKKYYRNRNRNKFINQIRAPGEHIQIWLIHNNNTSMCVYVYVHISLFLPECACTTIIYTSPWIFSLMYCCVSKISTAYSPKRQRSWIFQNITLIFRKQSRLL